jgi:hypothetical protein
VGGPGQEHDAAMNRNILAFTIIFAAAGPSWAGPSPSATEQAIQNAIKTNVPDTSREYWLALINVFGDKDRIGVIFGMGDNLAFCQEVADLYRSRYPNSKYFCEPAN